MNKKFTFIDLFSGIGGFHVAASDNGGTCVFSSEIDIEAAKAYEANFQLKPHGDITKINSENILEKTADRRHYASPMIRKKRKDAHRTNFKVSIWHENKGGNISSHPFSCALRADAYTRKQAGNAIPVPMIRFVIKEILNA